MKKNIIRILIIFLLLSIFQSVNAQCKQFIQSFAPMQLNPYVIDGNFLSPVVYEGEEISLTRTFLAGQKYKILILGMDLLDKQITITDNDGFIIFHNYPIKKNEQPAFFTNNSQEKIINFGSNYYEFEPEQSQNLKITVKIERKARWKKKRMQGCLGIVVGFLPKK